MNTEHDNLAPESSDEAMLAAEYVLGVLDAPARRAFAARMARDASLAREVAQWQRRLSPMAEEFEEVAPPLGLWPRIRAHVGLSAAPGAAPGVPLWERLAFWRGIGAAGFAATAASLLALALLPRSLPVQEEEHSPLPHPLRLVATASTSDGQPMLVAAVDDDACTMVVMPVRASRMVPAGKVAQLWLVSADGRPHSLGVDDRAPMQAITVPRTLRNEMLAQGLLAVSIEQPGGSPTGAPTGDVVARGPLTRL
jgi:anti-sigma-K factor RskA